MSKLTVENTDLDQYTSIIITIPNVPKLCTLMNNIQSKQPKFVKSCKMYYRL